ncbi:hypothetical protein C0Q70_00333 [Pomacea canaliculata]|uniref:NR LBD domain-containing protein n=1 Tax=Pomacea canaliculata TaxID=400727 RepID=A0A2T7PWD4_POMCA|nr:hypothetical protein C0Q70_00333 [Pomacea canaliculata]
MKYTLHGTVLHNTVHTPLHGTQQPTQSTTRYSTAYTVHTTHYRGHVMATSHLYSPVLTCVAGLPGESAAASASLPSPAPSTVYDLAPTPLSTSSPPIGPPPSHNHLPDKSMLLLQSQPSYESGNGMGGNHGGHYGSVAYSSTVTPPANMADINILSVSLSLPLHDFQADVAYGSDELSSEGFSSGYDATQGGLASFHHGADHGQPQPYVDSYGFEGYGHVGRDATSKVSSAQQPGYVTSPGASGLYPDHTTSPQSVGTPGLHDKYPASQTVPMSFDDGYHAFTADASEFYQQRFLDNQQKGFMKQPFEPGPQDLFAQSSALGNGAGGFPSGVDMDHKQSMYHHGVPGYDVPVSYCGDGSMYPGYHSAFYGGQGVTPCSSFPTHGVPTTYRADLSIQMAGTHHLHRRTSLSIPTPPTPDGLELQKYQLQSPTTPPTPGSARSPPPREGQVKESLLCAVCGDNAACQHYGVRTCEGCKGFFKYQVNGGEESPTPQEARVREFYDLLIQSIEILRGWAEKVPGFTDLCKEDQDLLFQSASLELFVLRLAYRVQPCDDKIIFDNGQVYHRLQCMRMFGDWIGSIMEFGISLHRMTLDISSVSCMAALALVTLRHGLKEQHKMEELQMKIIDCLRDHCTYNHEAQKKSNFFSRILGKTAELRSLSREGLQRMYFFKLENIIRAPPIIENLYLSSQLPF